MSWQDQVAVWSLVLGVAGLLGTLIGFGIALVQLHKTRNSAEAARRAITTTVNQVASNLVLVVLTQVQAIEAELDLAIHDHDARAAERVLVRWRQLASQLRGILSTSEWAAHDLLARIQDSAVVASDAKERLLANHADITAATKVIRGEIQAITDELGVLSVKITMGVGEETSRD